MTMTMDETETRIGTVPPMLTRTEGCTEEMVRAVVTYDPAYGRWSKQFKCRSRGFGMCRCDICAVLQEAFGPRSAYQPAGG